MKKQFLLLFLSLSLMVVGIKGFPCGAMGFSHDCCQEFSNSTLSNPYTTCCKGDDSKKKKNPSTPPKTDSNNIAPVVILSVAVVHSLPSTFRVFDKIQNKSPPKTPIYLNHEALLL